MDGVTYNLTKNNGPNAMHGGLKGFDKVNKLNFPWFGITYSRSEVALLFSIKIFCLQVTVYIQTIQIHSKVKIQSNLS